MVDSVEAVARRAAEAHGYLADEGLATSIFLALTLRAAVAARGRGRGRQDRGGQGARPLDRRRAGPAAVLRGHRRLPGRVRVGLLPPAPAPACGRGERRARWSRTSCTRERFLVRRPLLRAIDHHGAGPAGAARRRGRPGRRRVRGVPARDPLRLRRSRCPSSASCGPRSRPIVVLTSNRTRDVHDALKRRCLYHWIEHPDFERELAIVRLQGAARSPSARARRSRPRSRCCAASSSTSRPASPRRSTGPARWRALGRARLDEQRCDATLGTILKYREDQERVRARRGRGDRADRGGPQCLTWRRGCSRTGCVSTLGAGVARHARARRSSPARP